jgi:hypothetical protein
MKDFAESLNDTGDCPINITLDKMNLPTSKKKYGTINILVSTYKC